MPIILVDKQSFQTFYSECASLVDAINQTTNQIVEAELEIVSRGLKKPNIKKIVADAKKLNKPLSQIYFKNTGGNISISQTQVDQNFDGLMRDLLEGMFTKDITATAVEPLKRKQLADKLKQAKSFGIPSTVIQKALNMRSSSFVQATEAMVSVEGNYITVANAQNFSDLDSAPSDGEIDALVQEAFGEIFGIPQQ